VNGPRSRPFALALVLACAGCSGDPAMESRFSAEREIWRTTREFTRLSIRPDLVEEEQWRDLANRFEAIGSAYSDVPASADTGRASRAADQTRALAAHAYSRAGDVYAGIGDTAAAVGAYAAIETAFPDHPVAVGGSVLSRARIAEARGDTAAAIEGYRRVLDLVPPRTGVAGVQGAVLQLPLRVARLAAAAGAGDTAYGEARSYYEKLVGDGGGNAFEARSRLIDVATDVKDWNAAIAEMRLLEEEMRALDDPPEDPARVRLGIAEAQRFGLGDVAGGMATLHSVLEEYPGSPSGARALLALARLDEGRGRTQEALARLDRLGREFPGETDLVAEGALHRARILEREDRWPEALEILRALPIDHPLTEPALQAPLEIAAHYERGTDPAAFRQALDEAERSYRETIDRFPDRQFAVAARERLIRVLLAGEDHEAALEELLRLGEIARGTAMGAGYLLSAARIAETETGEPERALDLYRLIADRYPGTEFAERAAAAIERSSGAGGSP
jgi:tetratricopeptide (TPR) repeat protein